ncbi:glycosyltransferase family 4 protein [Eubacterium callanderi]|uniref:glycosyltransferase family 4 protein n=2 Tax=Eubacterium callanderi TaxID=53442 RepID=UPI001C125E3E|nr:glycosyltransferase family 4 protein [Eubacterium callanderi]MBU5304847.1 glycosyltransferase family 4 protein [Eubacterium callanderi]WPK68986.1 hypothetical protein EUCA2A_31610 [Eubacterium callanderi]WPK73284.1 hypothetical protein EUCA11A_31610 [Eubacterium callanderi]
MKTVIYIGGFELPDKNAAAQRVISNAKALHETGYNIILVDIDRDCEKDILETKSECFGFTRYSMKYTNKRLISITDLIAIIKIYMNDQLYVIAYNYPGIALLKMLRYCKKNRIKIFSDCTEWYGMLGSNFIRRIIKGMDSYIRMNVVQPRLDGIIVISKYLENFYRDRLPTVCVPPLTDAYDKKWDLKKKAQHQEIQIVYAGNPGKHKDKVNLIIEALSKNDTCEVTLTVIGITKEQFLELYPEDEDIIKKIDGRVEFLGFISHEQVIERLKCADYSMFYRYVTRVTMAGFPTKFAEAITCGTPVITNKTSDLGDYLIEGRNGYWVSDNIEDFFRKLTSLPKIQVSEEDRKCFDYRRYAESISELLTEVGE